MSTASLGHTIGRALLIAPPGWPRVLRFTATAWLLALGGIWAAQQPHQGLHEGIELSPAVHLLRDTALAVPMAALAIAVAGLVAVELLDRMGLEPAGNVGRVAWAIVAALVFAVFSVPGQELHGLLFGVEQDTGNWIADVGLDSGLVLLAAIVVLIPAALVRLAPWPPDPDPDPALHRPPARPAATAMSSMTAVGRRGEQGVTREA